MASRRKFSAEYKAEEIAMATDSGRSAAEVAKSVGVHQNTLSNWVKKAKANGEVTELLPATGRGGV